MCVCWGSWEAAEALTRLQGHKPPPHTPTTPTALPTHLRCTRHRPARSRTRTRRSARQTCPWSWRQGQCTWRRSASSAGSQPRRREYGLGRLQMEGWSRNEELVRKGSTKAEGKEGCGGARGGPSISSWRGTRHMAERRQLGPLRGRGAHARPGWDAGSLGCCARALAKVGNRVGSYRTRSSRLRSRGRSLTDGKERHEGEQGEAVHCLGGGTQDDRSVCLVLEGLVGRGEGSAGIAVRCAERIPKGFRKELLLRPSGRALVSPLPLTCHRRPSCNQLLGARAPQRAPFRAMDHRDRTHSTQELTKTPPGADPPRVQAAGQAAAAGTAPRLRMQLPPGPRQTAASWSPQGILPACYHAWQTHIQVALGQEGQNSAQEERVSNRGGKQHSKLSITAGRHSSSLLPCQVVESDRP